MSKPTTEKKHLKEKRDELVWALNYQGYNGEEIGYIFNVHRSVIHHVLKKKPSNWQPKWVKVQ